MSVLFWLLLLIIQADLFETNCDVPYCDVSYCKGTYCTQCMNGYYLFGGSCGRCYLYCKQCLESDECYGVVSSNCLAGFSSYANCTEESCSSDANCTDGSCLDIVACSTCPDGFYGSTNRCFQCNNKNCKCTFPSGCDECLPGYYGDSNGCENECPSDCLSCTSALFCIECLTGKFNRTCNSDCLSICIDGTCDIDSGICQPSCPTNQYRNYKGLCLDCQPRCSSCTDYNTCSSCIKSYFWGDVCQYDCTGCQSSCNKTNGCSSGCNNIYYQSFNEIKEGYECIHCPEVCSSCNGSDICMSCESGYWGSICQFSCMGCGGICTKNTGCGKNCSSAHYPVAISSGYECRLCPAKCDGCINATTCSICLERYYLDEANECGPCPVQCVGNTCMRTNGTCIAGCKDAWTGPRCDEACPEHCIECDQFNSSNCNSCINGLFGVRCENYCSHNCKPINGLYECAKTDGACLYGCKSGFWDKDCSKPCPEECLDQICNGTDGICAEAGTANSSVSPVTSGQSKSTDNVDQENNGPLTWVYVALGVLFLVAVVSIGFNVLLYRKRRENFPKKLENSISMQGQSMKTNEYQDLSRNRIEERPYSSLTNDYENNF